MPALSRAEHVPRSAYFKVAHRYLEARTELGKVAYRLKSFCLHFRQRRPSREREIRIRAAGGSPDSAAYLMQLRKSHALRMVDYQRVRIRNVNARLDYRRTPENVYLSGDKRLPYIGKLVLVHLPVRNGDLRFGKRFFQSRGAAVYRRYVVVQIKHLPRARKLAPDRLEYDGFVLFEHIRLNRQSVKRRFVEHGHIAYLAHRHTERSRDRRRRQRQNVDIFRYLFQLFLVRHSEALFLVDYQKSQIAEFHVVRKDSVRSDDDIDVAARKRAKRRLLLFWRAETRKHVNAYGKSAKARRYRLVVLHRKDRRRNEYRHLFAVADGFERRAKRHLRFAETHVAAKKPVHRNGLFHVGFYLA